MTTELFRKLLQRLKNIEWIILICTYLDIVRNFMPKDDGRIPHNLLKEHKQTPLELVVFKGVLHLFYIDKINFSK